MGASIQGTNHYFESHSVSAVQWGKTGWTVSPIGFGGYRIHDANPQHRQALRDALLSGCNLIDTSTNYGNGGSERLIGGVLNTLFGEGQLKRDQVVIVSKAGYVQGENLKLARERAERGMGFPEMVEYSDDCWHCISPEFLKDQITRSLSRLKLEQLDVLLLHNPEYFLKSQPDHRAYYQRIEAAFAYLETEVKAGRIQYYGVSSNTFPESKTAPTYTSLEVLLEIAQKLGPDHHFAVIQFPFNLYEPGAALEENNQGRTITEFAREHGIATLVNRPLNAFVGAKLVRLADYPAHEDSNVVGDFKDAMTRTTVLEAQYPGRDLVPANGIAWGHILRENFSKLSDLDTWKTVLEFQILPTLAKAFEALSANPAYRAWVDEYREASAQLFQAYQAFLESQASAESDRVAGMLDHLCPELHSSGTLSQKVIRLYLSIPGIDCVLVGMRQSEYVRDVVKLMELKTPLGFEPARQALIEISKKG